MFEQNPEVWGGSRSMWLQRLCFLASDHIFHSRTSSQSHSPHLIPICSGKGGKNAWGESKWKGRKGRNEWRRERAEVKSVTRLFLVVLVVTGAEKCWNIFLPFPLLLLLSPVCPYSYLLLLFPPKKTSLYPNITIGTKAVCSQNIWGKISQIPRKPGKAICGGDWGNNQDSRSHESFILVVTDVGQEMFCRRRNERCVCVRGENGKRVVNLVKNQSFGNVLILESVYSGTNRILRKRPLE